MKLTSLTRLAAVSAVALAAALHGGNSEAANEVGTPQTITVNGTVENDLTLVAAAGDLQFSATGDVTDIATATISPLGVVTNAPGTGIGVGSAHPASLVFDVAGQVVPQITITAGANFVGNDMFMGVDATAGTVIDMVCGGAIRITQITNDQTTPMLWSKPGAGAATGNPGKHTTIAGATVVKFGLSIATSAGTSSNSYTTGACGTAGKFNVVINF